MKVESQVIVDEYTTVELFLSLVHTARHAIGSQLFSKETAVDILILHSLSSSRVN